MKLNHRNNAGVALTICVAAAIGCSESDATRLVGSWECNSSVKYTLTNGHATLTQRDVVFEGKYSVDGGLIKLQLESMDVTPTGVDRMNMVQAMALAGKMQEAAKLAGGGSIRRSIDWGFSARVKVEQGRLELRYVAATKNGVDHWEQSPLRNVTHQCSKA